MRWGRLLWVAEGCPDAAGENNNIRAGERDKGLGRAWTAMDRGFTDELAGGEDRTF